MGGLLVLVGLQLLVVVVVAIGAVGLTLLRSRVFDWI